LIWSAPAPPSKQTGIPSVRPGTDGAFALGLMHVIINENLIDADHAEKYTVG